MSQETKEKDFENHIERYLCSALVAISKVLLKATTGVCAYFR